MQTSDKPEFAKLLGHVMAGYGKPLPDGGMVGVWFDQLAPFAPKVIAAAFAAYANERPDHAPVPNSIAARCRLLDGRPEENEAWAVAITSQDERETVVWTDEMRDAFLLAKPLMDAGDEVAARMAFKDAYGRMVAGARAANKPAHWNVSEGWDQERRQLAVSRAATAGLLAAPPAHLMLESNQPAGRPEGLKRVMELIGKLEDPLEKAARLRAEQAVRDDAADRARKEAGDEKVREYLKAHPEARYGQLLQTKAKQ